MALSKKFDEALSFAAEIHRQQTRKGAETPYIGHLLSVAGLVLEHGGSETQAIAALLFDPRYPRHRCGRPACISPCRCGVN